MRQLQRPCRQAAGQPARVLSLIARYWVQVAILCNHQRSVPKGHAGQMEKMGDRLAKVEAEQAELRDKLKAARAGKPWASKVPNKDGKLADPRVSSVDACAPLFPARALEHECGCSSCRRSRNGPSSAHACKPRASKLPNKEGKLAEPRIPAWMRAAPAPLHTRPRPDAQQQLLQPQKLQAGPVAVQGGKVWGSFLPR